MQREIFVYLFAVNARARWRNYSSSVVLVAAATGLGVLTGRRLSSADLVMIYVLVIGIAALGGRGPSLLAATLSVLSYDFFFVPPYHTFTVENERHLLTFATMFIVGLVMSSLTLKIRREERKAQTREARTSALYSLSRDVGAALDHESVARVAAERTAATFGAPTVVLLPDGKGELVAQATCGPSLALGPSEQAALRWAFAQGRNAGTGTDVINEARILAVPLRSGVETLGVLALRPEGPTLGGGQMDLLEAFSRQTALALARARFAEEAKAAALRARSEELRSSMLSAVSHDLRTPLATITGAATTLRDQASAVAPDQRADLLDVICEEAHRLERLVTNLLDMTRVDAGGEVKREWIPIEEIVGSSLARVEAELAGRGVEIDLAPTLPLVSVDPVLFGQVFVNLFENSAKHTPAGTPLEIRARCDGNKIEIDVADRGPGLSAGSEERIFERFVRGAAARGTGAGLGLAICRALVEAHGGRITGENRPGGGALFRVRLPLLDEAPSLPNELETEEPALVPITAEASSTTQPVPGTDR